MDFIFNFNIKNTLVLAGTLFSGLAYCSGNECYWEIPDSIKWPGARDVREQHFETPETACSVLAASYDGGPDSWKVIGNRAERIESTMYRCVVTFLWERTGDMDEGESIVFQSGSECLPGPTSPNDNGKGAPPPLACVGDPINILSGNSFQVENDFQDNAGLMFSRRYNSLDGLWRHNYSAQLLTLFREIIVTEEDGKESFFH